MKKRSLVLETDDSTLKKNFRELSSFSDVAALLEISPKFLHYILDVEKKYVSFEIPKKNGEKRQILSPSKNLKIIQKKMAYILQINQKTHKNSHGFTKNKSILSNADQHIEKNLVLNFDFADYFAQFHNGKIIGFFRTYYKFNNEVIGTLVSIFCYENKLPQGAPTSPILTNLLTYNFDKKMEKCCKDKKYTYTRYVDDVTISTNNENFDKSFVYIAKDNSIQLGGKLNQVLKETGFSVNPNKTRLRNKYQNQTVTGLTVNQSINVRRHYIRRIRAILHNLRINDDEAAEAIFYKHYHVRHSKSGGSTDKYKIVRGMIEFVGQVKGKQSEIFRKLAKEFNDLELPEYVFPINLLSKEEQFYEENCLIVNCDIYLDDESGSEYMYGCTGSAFVMKGVGVVTNAHTFKEWEEYKDIDGSRVEFYAHRYNEYDKKRKLEIIDINYKLDFAICIVEGIEYIDCGFEYSRDINKGESIKLLGFPTYRQGNSLYIDEGQVTQYIPENLHDQINPITKELGIIQNRYGISSTIFEGNSGGPVVNLKNKVIGIATKGTTTDGVVVNTIIAIDDVLKLKK